MNEFGKQLTAYAAGTSTVTLHQAGMVVSVPGGRIEVILDFPMLGHPHFPAGPGPSVQVLPDAAIVATVRGDVKDAAARVISALSDRIALSPTGTAEPRIPIVVGAPQPLADTDGAPRFAFPLRAEPVARRLYDIVLRVGAEQWHPAAPHAVYYRPEWTDFGLAHITDTHVARRIDSFRPTLRGLGRHGAADQLINWNDRFRGFVAYANRLHDGGELDLIVATGDLIDYQFESGDDVLGAGNAGFLRDLILGVAPGPEYPHVEELRVPILLTPGNHDYRHNPYHLVFDAEFAGFDVHRFSNYAGYRLAEADAAALTNALYFPGKDGVPNVNSSTAERMVAVEASMRSFREHLGDPKTYAVALGDHRIVMLDSAHDVGMVTSVSDALRAWLGTVSEDEATFVGGSPNCEGVSDEEYALALHTLESAPDDGLVIVALHAPLVNVWNGEYPYYLRQTQRPEQASQAALFVARSNTPHVSMDTGYLKRKHPGWFGRPGEPETAYLARGNSQDLLDYGVSRGRTDDLLRALAGLGTRRAADVVLAGHTHHHNEMVIRVLDGEEIAYFLDFYTANPRHYYPSRFLTDDDVEKTIRSYNSQLQRYRFSTTQTYVDIDPDAAAGATPWPMPMSGSPSRMITVPPYADPLDSTADPRQWWSRHRPLLLQTAALGPIENRHLTFSGFRLLSVRDNVIERIRLIPMERLEHSGFTLSVDEAAAVEPLPAVRYRDRNARFSMTAASGSPCVVLPGVAATHSLVYRGTDGALHESWDTPGSFGGGRLADRSVAPEASGDPAAYLDPLGVNVVVYSGADGGVHSLYWRGTEPAGHDALSAAAGAPSAVGSPSAYHLAGMNHVVYRDDHGGIHELSWTGDGAVSHGDISRYVEAPLAAGDPCGYPVTSSPQNIIVYRGVDDGIHSLYWADGPTGHDALSSYVGSPRASGEPVGYYTAHNDAHQVVYRGQDDHLHEIWWNGTNPASVWDLTAGAGAPKVASDPSCCYIPETDTKHVVFTGSDNHVHEISWAPGRGTPTWTDLTVAALAPPAMGRPVIFAVPGSPTRRVAYVGPEGGLHEIHWG